MKKVFLFLVFLSSTNSSLALASQADNKALAKENYERVNKIFTSTNPNKRKTMKKEFVDKIIIDMDKVNKITPHKVDDTITLIRVTFENDIKTNYSEYDIKKAKSLYKTDRDGVIKRLKASLSSNMIQIHMCANFGMAVAIEMHGITFQDIYTEKGTSNIIAKHLLQTCKIQ